MTFDYNFVDPNANPFLDWILAHLVIVIIVGVVITLAIVALVLIIVLKKAAKRGVKPKTITTTTDGIVFCRKCFNEFDASLVKCPYCKTKRS